MRMLRLLCWVAVLSAMASVAASAQTRYTTIVIDAGHGGFDRGGIPGQRVPEKAMNLDVVLRLKPLLERAGYNVILTRSTDVFVPLGTRVAIANPILTPSLFVYISTPPVGAELTESR